MYNNMGLETMFHSIHCSVVNGGLLFVCNSSEFISLKGLPIIGIKYLTQLFSAVLLKGYCTKSTPLGMAFTSNI
jgi:hypothetical protein